MATKKAQGKTKAAHTPPGVESLVLAGIGAASLARKHGKAILGEFVAEGRRQQGEAAKMARKAAVDAKAQVQGIVVPMRTGLKRRLAKITTAAEAGVVAVRSRLGIPSKADVDELAERVGALSRQLKSANAK